MKRANEFKSNSISDESSSHCTSSGDDIEDLGINSDLE